MEGLYFSLEERFALITALSARLSLVEEILLTLDSKSDTRLIGYYNKELSSLKSVLSKFGYDEKDIAVSQVRDNL